ncbi:MAG: radical SAM protein [bacterium]|nr:radical SAM protein [bacterium]
MDLLQNCTLCPRECGVNRKKGSVGYCGMTDTLVVARAAAHMWEEPCISGSNGSGTVFFSGCSLGCCFCQNYNISKKLKGKQISIPQLAEIFLQLQQDGVHNINLVTPSHFSVQIISALDIARKRGLKIPVIYNSSGYDSVETLRLLQGYIDVFLPDFKYFSPELSMKYSACKDYFEYASKAIAEMIRQVGQPKFSGGLITRGVIVRHLLLPGCLEDSKNVIKFLSDNFKDQIFISIMSQYTPVVKQQVNTELNRRVTAAEYNELIDYAISLGIENGFVQDGKSADKSFIPDFDYGEV